MKRQFSFKEVLCKFKIKLKQGEEKTLEFYPGDSIK